MMATLQFCEVLLFLCIFYVACYAIVGLYNITFHPLAKIPGPKLRGAFYFPTYWEIWTGDGVANVKKLHDLYGNTVRISPATVSFNNPEAWQEIYGQRHGKKPIPKDKEIYFSGNDGAADIISSNDVDHARIRRALSHAFSEASLREQEPLMNVYFDLLIQKLYEQIDSPSNGKVNIVRFFNFTTFDLIGDLCFAESFNALRTQEYNSWIANIFKGLKFARLFRVMRAYPLVGMPILAMLALFPALQKARQRHIQYTQDKTARRLDTVTDRRDFMSYILRHNDEKGMTRAEIMKTTGTLIIAGSETTATLLSGAIFHLLKNPSCMASLVQEIRSSFEESADMTFVKLANLRYLNVCLQEAFRIYPPVPGVLPRRTQPGGVVINGHFIPEDVSVGIHQWSAYHSAANFALPDQLLPERWLDDKVSDPRFASDKRGVVQPFSVGPRNCLGQHLAMSEMRAILARILWHFDVNLCEESRNCDEQKVFILWEKPDLMVTVKARER
ncbi:uncharacterized protein EAF02_002711 [Botrytis sinoallii]|uniref:uncharacterized protein n=1 Tax=Botrytis sinoallii TaxID=1463999 RepID=UPI00190068AD|nr:uncharacterized protein EAF02_002711 [Botrytis sinoallii]KAF7888170.1 hypothetical protein EAF02_002711 [Botrytis sinoallii]